MTKRRPVVITDAEASQDDQLRSRQIRYATMMGIRVVCLIIAGVLVSVEAPMLWLWLPLCVAGMVFLPWMAVIIANDRLPKEKYRLTAFLRDGRRRSPDAPSEVAGGAPQRPEITSTEQRIIDAEPEDR